MAASKRPFADPGPSNKESPPLSESDLSDSETEVDSDKETASSSFGNAEKKKIAPATIRYPLRTMEAKEIVNVEEHDNRASQKREINSSEIRTTNLEDDTDSDVSGDDYSTDTTAVESNTESEGWKKRSKVSSRKPIYPPSTKLRTKKQTTGPQTGVWALEAGGYKFGGLGWCDSQESKCQEGVLYSGATVGGQWPPITVPILLLCFGFCTYQKKSFWLSFSRHFSFSLFCLFGTELCLVVRTQSFKGKTTMTFSGIAYSAVAVILVIWINIPACLPLVWFFLSMSYRSRWAYDSNACITSAARRQKRGGKYEETYYEDPDEDEVIVSRNGADTVERPKRRIRKY
ncbi:hypothetical protein IAS59_004781 [Cryptococcus gattii]